MSASNSIHLDPALDSQDATEAFLDAAEFFDDVGLAAGDAELEERAEQAGGRGGHAQHERGNATPSGNHQATGRPPRVRLLDKLAYVLGISGLWACAFWLGQSPHTFYRLYTGLGLVLFTARYVTYRARKWHYYLLDLCYACNAVLLVHLWVAPGSALLRHATFAFDTGPLTASILAFRNAFVVHDLDRVTSLYLHLMPACVSWAQRWASSPSGAPAPLSAQPAGLRELVAVPLLFYAVWATAYYSILFLIARDRIQRRGYVTLFKYVTTRKRGAFAAIARRVPHPVQPAMYVVLHLAFCATTLLAAVMAWHSFAFHTTLLVVAWTLSIYHGADHYWLPRNGEGQHQQAIGLPRGNSSTVPIPLGGKAD